MRPAEMRQLRREETHLRQEWQLVSERHGKKTAWQTLRQHHPQTEVATRALNTPEHHRQRTVERHRQTLCSHLERMAGHARLEQ